MKEDLPAEEVAQAVLASGKYAGISRALVMEIALQEVSRGRSLRDAVKSVKSKLHQVAGAYLSEGADIPARQYARWLRELEEASASGDPEAVKEVCRGIMARHASTRERLPILEEFYTALFGALPPVRSVVDVACGLNPLAFAWMRLGEGAIYHAYDLYARMMGFVAGWLRLAGVEGKAEVRDVLASPPEEKVELALVLKAIPCLEQIDREAVGRMLGRLNATWVAVSFPVASLGGRSKGMVANYEARFMDMAAALGWRTERFLFKSELLFVGAREATGDGSSGTRRDEGGAEGTKG